MDNAQGDAKWCKATFERRAAHGAHEDFVAASTAAARLRSLMSVYCIQALTLAGFRKKRLKQEDS